MWCEDPIDFGEASPKLNERHSQCRRLSSRNLEITSILTAKEDKVVGITLDFLFVMDTVSNYSMRRERWLALAGSGDYRCQGLIVWQAKIWVILVLLQFQPHLIEHINVVAPMVQNTVLIGWLELQTR
jgi:hypothetical protein